MPKMDVTGLADPYVKIYLLYNSQRIAKRKTRVKKRTLSPVFNESFVFDIPNGADGLNNVSLEFMLIDWDRVTRNEVRSCNFAFISLLTFVLPFQISSIQSIFQDVVFICKYIYILII